MSITRYHLGVEPPDPRASSGTRVRRARPRARASCDRRRASEAPRRRRLPRRASPRPRQRRVVGSIGDARRPRMLGHARRRGRSWPAATTRRTAATIAANSSSVAITSLEQGPSIAVPRRFDLRAGRRTRACARSVAAGDRRLARSVAAAPDRGLRGREPHRVVGSSASRRRRVRRVLPCARGVLARRVRPASPRRGAACRLELGVRIPQLGHRRGPRRGDRRGKRPGSRSLPSRGELYLFATGTEGAARARRRRVGATGLQGNFVGPGVAWSRRAPRSPRPAINRAVVASRASPPGGPSGSQFLPPARPGAKGSVRARLVGADGHARGGVVVVSAAGDDVGVPSVAWIDGTARVAYAHRKAGTEARTVPWTIALAHWPSGAKADPRAPTWTWRQAGAAAVSGAGRRAHTRRWRLRRRELDRRRRARDVRPRRACVRTVVGTVGRRRAVGGGRRGRAVRARERRERGLCGVAREVPGHGAPVELRAGRVQCTD